MILLDQFNGFKEQKITSLFGEGLKLEEEIKGKKNPSFLMLNNKCSRCTETEFDQGKDRPRGRAKKNYAFFFFL